MLVDCSVFPCDGTFKPNCALEETTELSEKKNKKMCHELGQEIGKWSRKEDKLQSLWKLR